MSDNSGDGADGGEPLSFGKLLMQGGKLLLRNIQLLREGS